MTTETRDFATFVEQRFGGTLYRGAHDPNGHACLHEALNVYQGKAWSDDTTGTLDLRALNDAKWSSDEARTAAMLPLGALVLGWPKWTPEKRQAWAKAVADGVIRRILPPTLRRVAELIPDKAPELVAAALRCEKEGNARAARAASRAASESAAAAASESASRAASESAASAAWAAAAAARAARAAAESAASAAWAAAESAASAAWSASESASDVPLQELTRIMVEAAS